MRVTVVANRCFNKSVVTMQRLGNPHNKFYQEATISCRGQFRAFILNLRYTLAKIGLSFANWSRITSCDGVRLSQKYYEEAMKREDVPMPNMMYLVLISQRLRIPLYRLMSPTSDFKSWFDEVVASGEWEYVGLLVRCFGSKIGTSIDVKEGSGQFTLKFVKQSSTVVVDEVSNATAKKKPKTKAYGSFVSVIVRKGIVKDYYVNERGELVLHLVSAKVLGAMSPSERAKLERGAFYRIKGEEHLTAELDLQEMHKKARERGKVYISGTYDEATMRGSGVELITKDEEVSVVKRKKKADD
jgi:hypothetical protein